MTTQQQADAILRSWQLQRELGIKPEDRKIEQDNDPSFYDLQLRMIAEQMDVAQ